MIAGDFSGEAGSKIEAEREPAQPRKNALDLVKNSREGSMRIAASTDVEFLLGLLKKQGSHRD
ncbi:hypothetical protein LRP31_21615 [Mesorhizobium mediterraneum]|uniref:CopG family transcriptional regulator n=1 Tax=Mesorhizobium mediterraneum TaxID=43617 RepID=A0AB36R6H7_9HYPH|nr:MULTISPECIES: hypothetical protein [Mesorhizobium]RWN36237.1 MAG: hypothetical protein EOR96_25620 [Mesorhizobium sp.]PAP99848.1 hypothetical protein CIT25_22625 [Mesorhizobium mediterraneum]RUU25734.1 hypothetical protein EOC94_30260 [Mesorhizobium sp. M6A.T.Ce.TU.016.01.1.1]RWQ37533.1 MAG: hypothetical protein EOS21_21935 [Mesorhizobium sp.]WIW51658.1 hypothetical protein LRP31_21615 [Mesorhizobium mediterraneum]